MHIPIGVVGGKELDEKVYTDADLAENFNSSFINIKLDAEGEFGSILAEQMDISAFPTLIYLTPMQKPLRRLRDLYPLRHFKLMLIKL